MNYDQLKLSARCTGDVHHMVKRDGGRIWGWEFTPEPCSRCTDHPGIDPDVIFEMVHYGQPGFKVVVPLEDTDDVDG